MRWFESPNINFVGNRKKAYIFTTTLVVISLGVIIFKGLQYGIDFKGGKEIALKFDHAVEVNEIRDLLTEPLGSQPEVKLFGSASEILIRTENPEDIDTVESMIRVAMGTAYPDNPFEVEKSDTVGPKFANDLKFSALQSIIYATIIIFLYILLRFRNWRFSAGAIVGLLADVIVTLGLITILDGIVNFNLLIDQNIIAAFLTIVGYSINDTVVVFDRIRENRNIHKGMELNPLINKSLNDTLSRTVITSLTTFFTVLILFIFGGEVLKGLSFALLIGIVHGTYSSLLIASPLVVDLSAAAKKN